MSDNGWTQLYLYGPEHESYLRKEVASIISQKPVLALSDFAHIDILHPAGHSGLSDFLSRIPAAPLKILDLGSGLGGTSRYLASLGHSVLGIDALPHFVDISRAITEALNLNPQVAFQANLIEDAVIEDSSFDVAIFIGVLLCTHGVSTIRRTAKALKPGGKVYVEDYFQRGNLTEAELALSLQYHRYPFRTRRQYYEEFEEAGFEVTELEDWSRQWSEVAWARAEKTLKANAEGPGVGEGELNIYGKLAPTILSHMDNLQEDELRTKYPYTCGVLGTELVYNTNKIAGIMRVMLTKKA
jgi:SAM-dependent methyltransferase